MRNLFFYSYYLIQQQDGLIHENLFRARSLLDRLLQKNENNNEMAKQTSENSSYDTTSEIINL